MYTNARPKGFIEWRPHGDTALLLQKVQMVLEQYTDHLPLTLRQIFYRLVATFHYDKTERAYKRLCDVLVRARRARFIPFDVIRDDGWTRTDPGGFGDVADFYDAVSSAVEKYKVDKQHRQPRRIILLVEAAGMVPQVQRVADRYSVQVMSSSGFDSVTIKYKLALELQQEGRPALLLHIGDLDPSGVCIFDSMRADVLAFMNGASSTTEFRRLALTPEQVELYQLPTAPPKETDRRGNGVLETCQAEALPPDVLASIVDQVLKDNVDQALFKEDCEREQTERDQLREWLEGRGK